MNAREIRGAGLSLLTAMARLRDAKRLLDSGFSAETAEVRRLLSVPVSTLALEAVVELVITKEAGDLLDLYDTDPIDYPEGDTAERARARVERVVKRRYARGKCGTCRGPALACARRHARGMSCA